MVTSTEITQEAMHVITQRSACYFFFINQKALWTLASAKHEICKLNLTNKDKLPPIFLPLSAMMQTMESKHSILMPNPTRQSRDCQWPQSLNQAIAAKHHQNWLQLLIVIQPLENAAAIKNENFFARRIQSNNYQDMARNTSFISSLKSNSSIGASIARRPS